MMNVFMWQFSCVFCVDTVCHLAYDLPPYIGHVASSVWSLWKSGDPCYDTGMLWYIPGLALPITHIAQMVKEFLCG